MSNNKCKTIRKSISLVLAVILVLGQVVSASAAEQPKTMLIDGKNLNFEEAVAAIVVKSFDGLAAELAPQVIKEITPEVDALAARVLVVVDGFAMEQDRLTTEVDPFKYLGIEYPSQAVVDSIPPQALPMVRADVEKRIIEDIAYTFVAIEDEVKPQVMALLEAVTPKLIAEIETPVRAMIPKVHAIIEAKIEERIMNDIMNALPELEAILPASMAKMSPEEIAAQMKPKVINKVESVVRPDFEKIMSTSIKGMMLEKLKKPIQAKMMPNLDKIDARTFYHYADELPDYLQKVVSKDFIKTEIEKNVVILKERIPVLVEEKRPEMDQKIDAYIDAAVEKDVKIYIQGSYLKAPIQPVNVGGRLLVPFRAIAEALDADVEWKAKERKVTMKKGDTNIVLAIDSPKVLVNGAEKTIDANAQIVQGSTVVPVRFIAETFNMDVDWQGDWKMVSIAPKTK